MKLEALAAVDAALEADRLHVGRRRHGIQHPAGEPHAVRRALHIHLRLDMLRGIAADGGDVDVAEMRQVHQVVHHQHGGRFDRIHGVLVRPVDRVVVIRPAHDLAGIGLRRIAHPDPDERVLLHYREAAHARALEDAVLAGHVHAGAGAIEDQAVVAAFQAALDHLADVQRRAAMAAHVEQRRGVVLLIAIEHDRFVADPPRQRRGRRSRRPRRRRTRRCG